MWTRATLAQADSSLVTSWWARPLVLIYFFAGMTGIAYEVLWVRMLALQFGVSIFGMVVTVAAFMAGLGGGSLLGAWLSRRVTRPLLFFAALEGGVALYALGMPELFQWVDHGLSAGMADADLSQWYAVQALVSFLVLSLPALAMGVGFPIVLRAFAASPVTLAKIYGFNTLGGAVGALVPLALLPELGWSAALYVAVAGGLSVAVAALVLGLRLPPVPEHYTEAGAARARPALLDMVMYAGVGAAALMLQVGWTRLYGMLLLRTEYVLAIILCVFLIGIGVGSVVVRDRTKPAWLAWLPPLAAAFALLSLWALPWLAQWADQRQYDSLFSSLVWQGLALALLTLPVTLLLGAWLPLLSNQLSRDGRVGGAWLYGANSVGAGLGALLGGFVLVPDLGTPATIGVAALLLFVCGVVLARAWRASYAAPLLVGLLVPVTSLPEIHVLLPKTQAGTRDLAVYEDALAITHVVEQPDGQRLLLADMRWMDASTEPAAVAAQQNQARLPLLLHPAPKSVLFLGMGTGISVAGATAFPEDLALTAVEVSQGAIDAAREWFAPLNQGVMERVQVVRDDARRFLRADTGRYDVIIGDLFHPDLAGRGNLLSIQQFQRARERLAPAGVFVQWVALNQFDLHSLQVVLRSFERAFPHSMLFIDGFRLALVGVHEAWQGVPAMRGRLDAMTPAELSKATGGEGVWTWLGRYCGEIPSSEGPVQDEWRPKVEFMLPRARYAGTVDLAGLLDNILTRRPAVERAAEELGVAARDLPAFEPAYVATELAVRSWQAAMRGQGGQSQRLLRIAYEANRQDRWIGFSLADQMLLSLPQAVREGWDEREALEAVIAVRPDHVGALKELWRLARVDENHILAEQYRERIIQASPLEREVQAASGGAAHEETSQGL